MMMRVILAEGIKCKWDIIIIIIIIIQAKTKVTDAVTVNCCRGAIQN